MSPDLGVDPELVHGDHQSCLFIWQFILQTTVCTANSKDQNPISDAFDICLVVELYKQMSLAYHTESSTIQPTFR
jgi:hypothetical protein